MDVIEDKFFEILSFSEEVVHVDRASRVSMDTIQKTLKQMDSNIKNLETDLKNAKAAVSEEDKFLEVMGVSFYKQNKNKFFVPAAWSAHRLDIKYLFFSLTWAHF